MKKTKGPSKKNWYIGMEYLPGQFGIIEGPFFKNQKELNTKTNRHHCLLYLRNNGQWYLTHRKNTGRWKTVEKGPIKVSTSQKKNPVQRKKQKLK